MNSAPTQFTTTPPPTVPLSHNNHGAMLRIETHHFLTTDFDFASDVGLWIRSEQGQWVCAAHRGCAGQSVADSGWDGSEEAVYFSLLRAAGLTIVAPEADYSEFNPDEYRCEGINLAALSAAMNQRPAIGFKQIRFVEKFNPVTYRLAAVEVHLDDRTFGWTYVAGVQNTGGLSAAEILESVCVRLGLVSSVDKMFSDEPDEIPAFWGSVLQPQFETSLQWFHTSAMRSGRSSRAMAA